MAIQLVEPQSAGEWRQARRLLEEYAGSLEVDLAFQDFAHELKHLTEEYGPPTGAFLLAEDAGVHVGCIGVRQLSGSVAEIKRLYVVPAARGRRVGQLLAERIVAVARQRGYTQLLLDTLPSMTAAQSLYAALGFTPTSAYRFNPVAGTVFLRLDLR